MVLNPIVCVILYNTKYNWSPNSIALKDAQRIKTSCGKQIAFLKD